MLIEKLKGLIKTNEDEPQKKKIENLVVFLIILIITVIVINAIWNKDDTSSKDETTLDKNKKLASSVEELEVTLKEDSTAKELEEILSNINGVGSVKVMLTYSQTSQTVPLYNQDLSEKSTEETDKEGGTRKILETDTSTQIIYKEENGEKVPITQSVISPTIQGAIITAQGADSATVKTNIIQAVEAATGLATHKIQVFEMKK